LEQISVGADEETPLEMPVVAEDGTGTGRSLFTEFLLHCSKLTGSDDIVFCVAQATITHNITTSTDACNFHFVLL